MFTRRQGAARTRHPREAVGVHERRAVSPLHPHRTVAEGRDLRLRRLRQCSGAQILARRQVADVVGRPRHQSRRVQHRPQHLHRRRWLGLCRRPREPPRPGVRRQRQVPDAVEQSAPPVRALHGLYPAPSVLYRRARAGAAGQPQQPQPRPAGQHRRQPGQAVVALRRHACRHGADLIPRPTWAQRRFPRRPLRRRGIVDPMAAILSRHAAAGVHSFIAEIRAGALREDLMAEIVGSGEFKYRIVEDWAQLPDGWSFKEVAAVGVDSKDNVYAFSRGEHPIMVFDRDGNFLRSWGEGQYPRAHGVHMGPDDSIYLTDDGGHFVRKCSLDGKVLLEIGVPGKPAPYMSGEPFHRCTHTALSPKGEIYVSDGYGNAKVHKYSPDGKLLMSWGEPGTNPGEFNIVHNICTDADGWVYVADRENHRVQVFDGNGKYEAQWNNMHRPCGLYCCRGPQLRFIIGELGPSMAVNLKSPN